MGCVSSLEALFLTNSSHLQKIVFPNGSSSNHRFSGVMLLSGMVCRYSFFCFLGGFQRHGSTRNSTSMNHDVGHYWFYIQAPKVIAIPPRAPQVKTVDRRMIWPPTWDTWANSAEKIWSMYKNPQLLRGFFWRRQTVAKHLPVSIWQWFPHGMQGFAHAPIIQLPPHRK